MAEFCDLLKGKEIAVLVFTITVLPKKTSAIYQSKRKDVMMAIYNVTILY